MAKLKQEDILKAVEDMTVMELSELVKALEDKFGVTAAPVAAAGAPAAGGAAEAAEEKSEYDVVLKGIGENKIAAIKAVRELLPDLGLQDAKAKVESAPAELLKAVKKEDAEEAKKKLEAAGCTVELK